MSRLIPVNEIQLGTRARIVPQKPDIARGKDLPALASSQEVTLSEYHFDLARRGAIHVYEIDPTAAPLPADAPDEELGR